jgi:N-acetylneuraminate synthase
MNKFKIDEQEISQDHPPYIIAEVSANHNGSLQSAKEIILAAKAAGAHAVKLQTYSADSMTIDCDKSDFIVKGGLWHGYKLYDLYRDAGTPYEWHEELFRYAQELKISCFSTPFDEEAFQLLESLNSPAYKIASFELTDLPLIRQIAKSGKPLLISTGMGTLSEITDAVDTALKYGSGSVLLFHCISSYPTPISHSNLKTIITLKNLFQCPIGLSDHTLGTTAAIASIGLGAVAVEKHFTLSRSRGGFDAEFSIEPFELKSLVTGTRDAWLALGSEELSRPNSESLSCAFRRSIYFVKDVACGEQIKPDQIRRIRPGHGLEPKHFDSLIGKRVTRNVSRGDPVSWDVVEP